MQNLYLLDLKPASGKPGLLVCRQSGNVCDPIFTVVEFPGTFTKISICQFLIMNRVFKLDMIYFKHLLGHQ